MRNIYYDNDTDDGSYYDSNDDSNYDNNSSINDVDIDDDDGGAKMSELNLNRIKNIDPEWVKRLADAGVARMPAKLCHKLI